MTILKHTPCKVVGWSLHVADRVRDSNAERLLSYMPQVIWVKVPGATWRVKPDMEPGVFPLTPVRRQWIVNEATGAAVSRRGFTLVPDGASTAFMIQGSTLDASLAECGDIFTLPGLTEMVNAYVILSRVRDAETLLLLRAFSPSLFRNGSPPGPACLLKLLRHRLSNADSENQAPVGEDAKTPYTPQHAVEEYKELSERWEQEKRMRKARGMEWQCFECKLVFPAAGFGAKATSTKDVHLLCVAPGHWRRCIACTANSANGTPDDDAMQSRKTCQGCQQQRSNACFDGNSDVCTSCTLQENFDMVCCKSCGKVLRKVECAGTQNQADEPQCLACAPCTRQLKCTICEQDKNALAFARDYRAASLTIRRCRACSIQCVTCEKLVTHCSQFATNSNECWSCYKKSRVHRCDACKEHLGNHLFNSRVLTNARMNDGERKAVCLKCQEAGYSPEDTQKYLCAGGHERGHLDFDTQLLYNVKRKHSSTLICKYCAKCDGCQAVLPRKDAFNKTQMRHYDESGSKRPLVCHSCRQKGVTPRTLDMYICLACDTEKGKEGFKSTDVNNFTTRGYKLTCTECNARLAKIISAMSKAKNRCRCEAPVQKGAKKIHTGKCWQSEAGRRMNDFPGRGQGVSPEDWKFFQSWPKRKPQF